MTYKFSNTDMDSFEIICRCNDPVYDYNEDDETLARNRASADETGYDADMEFWMWVDRVPIRVNFSLYGIEFQINSMRMRKPELLNKITDVMKIVYDWFAYKCLDDISEKFYNKVETELGKKIFDALRK